MSIKLMSDLWKFDFPQRLLLILLALADFARDDGTSIYPSKKLLSWKTGYSVRQVQRLLRILEKEGILKVHKSATSSFPTMYLMDLRGCRRKNEFISAKMKSVPIMVATSKKLG